MSPRRVEISSGLAPAELEPELVVAVVAAIDGAWPKPVAATREITPTSPRWRWSGRWWARGVLTRNDKPWVGPHG